MLVYVLLGAYLDCAGCTYESIIAIKPLEQDCLDIAQSFSEAQKDIDGWDNFLIQEWTEFGCQNEYQV